MTKVFSKRLDEAISAGVPVCNAYPRRVSNAYACLHQVLDSCYLPLPYKDMVGTIRRSNAWQSGFSLINTPSSPDIFNDLKKLVLSSSDGTFTPDQIGKSQKLLQSAIQMALVDIEKVTRGEFLVWRVYPMLTNTSTKSYSNKWHYDVHIQQDHPYSMYYLDADHLSGGGTYILPANHSSELSNRTGYISSPLTDRVQTLQEIDPSLDEKSTFYIPASSGKAIIFWPSRVLHKGELPQSSKPRVVLHFSFIPVSQQGSIEERTRTSFEICQYQFAEQSSALPFYQSQPSLYDSLIFWDGRIEGQNHAELLVRSIFPSGHSLPFRPYSQGRDINSLINDMRSIALANGSSSELQVIDAYLQSVNHDKLRYYSCPREHTFWPNSEHPKYPSSIYDHKPFVGKTALVSRSTSIGSAGSCFAVEISEHFQKNGYNYFITEKPESIDDGVQVDGYIPGDTTCVRFSANYGIYFNSLSLLQMAERAFSIKTFKRLLISDDIYPGWFQDPYRELVLFRSISDYVRDYPLHTAALKKLLCEVEVFIFTMGLNECWRFRDDNTTFSRNPRSETLYPLIYHSTLCVDDHVNAISSFYEIVKAANPAFKLILSLSPVAFLATGNAMSQHIISANTHSKSVQRVAAQILCDKYEDIYYFPSYEYVTSCLKDPWKPDGRHLKEASVRKVMEFFEDMFVH